MKNNASTLAFTLSVMTLAMSQAYAESVIPLDKNHTDVDETIVVTATRYQQSIDKIPGAVTVISSDELRLQSSISDDLTAILANLVPSMTPSRQKLSNQGENLRGRTALILVDGVPQNNPLRNGNRYGHPIDSAALSRIEVVSGASAVQGMGATGGIINYITLAAQEGDKFKQTIGTRINGTGGDDALSKKVWYNLTHDADVFDFALSSSWNDQGIYYDGNGDAIGMNLIQGENQDASATNILAKFALKSATQRLEFSTNQSQLESHHDYVAIKGNFKEGIVGTTEKGDPSGEPVSNDVQSYNLQYSHYNIAQGELSVQFFSQDFEAVYGQASWYPTQNVIKDQGKIVSSKKGMKLAYSNTDLFSDDDNWVAGLDILSDEVQQVLLGTGLGVTPEMSYFGIAPFIQGDMLITDNLRLSAGLRYEDTQVEVKDDHTLYSYGLKDSQGVPYGQVDINGGKQNFSQLVYNLGLVYNVTDSLNIVAGANQGFGLPDIGRVLRGNWVGNKDQATTGGPSIDFMTMPAVEPVLTDNYEIGLNYNDEKWQLSASSYYSLAKDGANLSLNTGGTYDVVRQRTEITGIELTARYQLNDQLSMQAIYASVNGEIDSDNNGSVDSDMDLKNVSPDRFMFAIDYDITEQISTRVQMNTLMDADNSKRKQTFDGYSLADAYISYDLANYGKVSLAIENLTDKFYIGYFSQIRNHSSYYFSGRGRTYALSYVLNF